MVELLPLHVYPFTLICFKLYMGIGIKMLYYIICAKSKDLDHPDDLIKIKGFP